MKPLRHARAAALIALGAAFAAVAQAQDAAESLDRIRSVAAAAVRKNLPASAEVSADSLDSRLRLAACACKLQAEAGAMRGALRRSGEGKSVSVGLDLGGSRTITKKNSSTELQSNHT